MSTDVWGMIHAERQTLAADVQGLTDPQWATPDVHSRSWPAVGRPARVMSRQMGKVPAHASDLVDLDQQVGDPDPAEQLVGAPAKLPCRGRHRGAQWSNRQTPLVQLDIRELVVGQQVGHLRHPLIDLLTLVLEIRLARGLDGDRDRLGPAQLTSGGLGSRYSSKARYWRLPATLVR